MCSNNKIILFYYYHVLQVFYNVVLFVFYLLYVLCCYLVNVRMSVHTEKSFGILLNQPEIRLYLPCAD